MSQFYKSVDKSKWLQKMKDLDSSINSKAAYKVAYGTEYYSFIPPEGTVYKIGMILPKFSLDKPTYDVVKGLYLGARLASLQFNKQHTRVQVKISYFPSRSRDLDEIVEKFASSGGDVIIGPLFSEQAKKMVGLAAEYNIPIVAPLATADISSENSPFYQANSTFAAHGKTMARYAIKVLGLDTFAVLSGRGSNGAESARAFRKKVKSLGGTMVAYRLVNFKRRELDISFFLKNIGSKLTTVDAIYAPLTGSYAVYLVEQLVSKTNTFDKPVVLLGSQKWAELNYGNLYSANAIYFSVNSYWTSNSSHFRNSYRKHFKTFPNKYSAVGYDVTRFILQRLEEAGNPTRLNEAMQQAPFYRGLIKHIYFGKTHSNQAVQLLKVSGDRPALQYWFRKYKTRK